MSGVEITAQAREAIRKSAADMKRCDETPAEEWGGHKRIFLANQEGFLGGFTLPLLNALEEAEQALVTERSKIEAAVEERVREGLLDDDGPVLLELREAISDTMEGFCFRDEEGEEVLANDPNVEALGNEVSDRVKAKLRASLDSYAEQGGGEQTNAEMLDEFHTRFNYERTSDPALRLTLHQEEHDELVEALEDGGLGHIARELADVVYVAYGSAWSLGLDLDAAVREVHRANLSKLGDDGQPLYRADGKVLKGPNFLPPDMSVALPFETEETHP